MADTALIKRNIGRMVDKGAPESDIDAYLKEEGVSLAELQSAGRELASTAGGFAGDVAKSAGIGVVEGGLEMAGGPGDIRNAILGGAEWLSKKTMSPEFAQTVSKTRPAVEGFLRRQSPVQMVGPIPVPVPLAGPSSEDLKAKVKEYTGDFYEPQSTTGEYARTLGRFLPNAASPGTMARRVVGGVVMPAVVSETAGQLTKGTAYEPVSRLAAAIFGSVAGSGGVSAANRGRDSVKGVTPGTSRVLEKTLTPDAEAKLAQLGPDALLMESTPATFGVAQGLATRPGDAQSRLVNALKARQEGANQRLTGELNDTLGPAVSPARIEHSLDAQRASLQPMYEAVTGLNEPVNLNHVFDQLRIAIPGEAGATQQALRRVQDMIAPAGPNGQRIVRTDAREILNVRQALDDEIGRLGDAPKAQRTVTQYRALLDRALGEAVPDLKVLDATYANSMRESESLRRGGQILKLGPEGIRPEDLIAERQALPLPAREAMRHGARAEIDRLVGTKANDITALKQLVQSDGDWNRTKLAEIFGGREARRIFNAVDREAAFQDSYRKLVENSQTAQRLQGAKMVDDATVPKASARDLTVLGAVAATGQAGMRKVAERFSTGKRAAADDELSGVFSSVGASRDDFVSAIRAAQAKRKANATTTGDELLRSILAARAAKGNEQ